MSARTGTPTALNCDISIGDSETALGQLTQV